MNNVILFKQGEIILKGNNRREFEAKLISNIKRRLRPFGEFKIYCMQSIIYAEPIGDCDVCSAFEAGKKVFGAAAVSLAASCEKDVEAVFTAACEHLGNQLEAARSFKVETKRSDKQFPMGSIELSRVVGGLLHDRFPHLKPEMNKPELTVNIEIRDFAAYVHGNAEQGAGGLPIGTAGSMVSLLSGGIDSPVATYMMAKRGVRIIPVHFFTHPYTSELAKEKVLRITSSLSDYCERLLLEVVPFTRISLEIRRACPQGFATIIMRRFMLRICEEVAKENGALALVTGDNLGQVASQTVEAISATEQCVGLPVFRPLIGFDKREITDIARRIGTYDTSILPYDDCCTVFTPRKPKIKPKIDDVLKAESSLDVAMLVNEALEGIVKIRPQ